MQAVSPLANLGSLGSPSRAPQRCFRLSGARWVLIPVLISLAGFAPAAESVASTAGDGVKLLLERRTNSEPLQRPDFSDSERAAEREAMVRRQIEDRGVSDVQVLSAMRRVPRHEFVPQAVRERAYDDTPLSIGHGQTISQPFIVAFMTEVLQLDSDDRVLEVGTGSAYQAAILAEIVRAVTTIEIIEPLAEGAAQRLERLGYTNITVLQGDGYYGHAEAAPFDAIIVTAAASHVPPPLIEQLKPGGQIVIPVGQGWTQNLLLVDKDARGDTSTRNLMAVRFVPLTGDH